MVKEDLVFQRQFYGTTFLYLCEDVIPLKHLRRKWKIIYYSNMNNWIDLMLYICADVLWLLRSYMYLPECHSHLTDLILKYNWEHNYLLFGVYIHFSIQFYSMDGWMYRWMDGCMYVCMDGWMDGWIDGWKKQNNQKYAYNWLGSLGSQVLR